MKLIIDIPQGLKIDFENENWTALTCAEMKNALINGIPLEDIKAEIGKLQDNPYITDDEYELVRGILKIIDKQKVYRG